jgi:hypothetical protein
VRAYYHSFLPVQMECHKSGKLTLLMDSWPLFGRSKDAASFTYPPLFLSHLREKRTKKQRKQRKLISIIH